MDYGLLSVTEYRKLHQEREGKYRILKKEVQNNINNYKNRNLFKTITDQNMDVIQFSYGCSD